MSNKKIGFWAVFSIVTGSQIGSSVFLAPTTLAPYGLYSIVGLLIAGLGAITLSFVFAQFCSHFPKTGGPHVYVNHSLGSFWGFFTGWTYWVISWVSTTAVLITIAGYLAPLLHLNDSLSYLILELIILLTLTTLNLKGLSLVGYAEIILTFLKFVPLLLISIVALGDFNLENITLQSEIKSLPISKILGDVTLLTLWGFVGMETATTPAEAVLNPSKTIPKAIIWGTMSVIAIYLISSISIIGLIPTDVLMKSNAPYADAAEILFGGSWQVVICIIATIICLGTLNSWILTSGQILLGLANDGFVPKKLGACNKYGSPYVGILLSSSGIAPLLILVMDDNIANQIREVIDVSVTAFLFVYLICSISFLVFLSRQKKYSITSWAIGLISAVFCLWVLYETRIIIIASAFLFVLSGAPMYFFWYKKQQRLPA